MKEALADLKANTDPARAAVIKLNVRDARDSLRRRLSQISPETLAIQVQNTMNLLVLVNGLGS